MTRPNEEKKEHDSYAQRRENFERMHGTLPSEKILRYEQNVVLIMAGVGVLVAATVAMCNRETTAREEDTKGSVQTEIEIPSALSKVTVIQAGAGVEDGEGKGEKLAALITLFVLAWGIAGSISPGGGGPYDD